MNRIKKLSFIVVGLLYLYSGQTTFAQSLTIWNRDNSVIKVINLKDEPLITISKESMQISTPELVLNYGIKEVHKFTYGDFETGISNKLSPADFYQEGLRIVLHNVKSMNGIALYGVNGMSIPINAEQQGDDYVISLENLSSGVYLLNVEGKTTKILRK